MLLGVSTFSWGQQEGASSKPSDRSDLIRESAAASINGGLDWLKQAQRNDGSWSNANYPAMTALGLWAFSRSNHPDRSNVCSRAADFIAGFAQKDGGIYKPAIWGRMGGGLSVYNTAICMTALYCYDAQKYADLVLKARTFMAGSQIQGDSSGAGGFGYEQNSKRNRADLSNTGWALMAMRYTQGVEDLRPAGSSETARVDWAAALKFIEKMQDSDERDPENFGAFGYDPDGDRGGVPVKKADGTVKLQGFGSMTYAGLESMIYAQVDRTDPRVRSALQWASMHWSLDENPGMGSKGLFYYYNVMSKALSVSGVDTLARASGGDPILWKDEIIEKLAASQRPDGSWINSNSQFWEGDAMLVTAYSILTLQNTLIGE